MRPIYLAALAKIDAYCEEFGRSLYGLRQERDEALRVSLRARRDYWHMIGSRIRARMARQ